MTEQIDFPKTDTGRRYTITPPMVLALIWLYNNRRPRRYIDPSLAPDEVGGVDRLLWWGFVEEEDYRYRITPSGVAFVKGQLRAPKYVKRVIEPDFSETVSVEECLTGRYDYKQLMQ